MHLFQNKNIKVVCKISKQNTEYITTQVFLSITLKGKSNPFSAPKANFERSSALSQRYFSIATALGNAQISFGFNKYKRFILRGLKDRK